MQNAAARTDVESLRRGIDRMNNNINPQPGNSPQKQKGGIGYVVLWLLGVPIPVLILFALLRGCA